MRTTILTTHDAATWNAYLDRLPGADIYHTPEYHRAHEANGDGAALCWVAEDADNLLLYPFMRRWIPGTGWPPGTAWRDVPMTGWYDIQSAYGYSGPIATSPWLWFEGPAWAMFHDWCKTQHVVAEFIRFNPLTHDSLVGGPFWDSHQDRCTVVLDLSGTPDNLWDRYPSTQRNMVRKAQQRGLELLPVDGFDGKPLGWPAFRRLYGETMERNGASDYYTFSDAYFRALAAMPAVKLFVVTDGYEPVSAAVFLLYRDRLHYHLAASNERGREWRAGNLLLHQAALWGQAHGCRWLHLGGGRTSAPDDSLLRFKASVSRDRLPFYVGRRIHNQEAYRQLCRQWRERHPGADPGDFFPLYRKEVAA